MDAHTLLQCFAGTLEVTQAVREKAEQELRGLARTPGFLGACLDIIGASDVSPGCKKAAAVYFKNRIVRHWDSEKARIDAGEKPIVVERLVGVLARVDLAMKNQLLPVFRTLISAEYPGNWPSLLPEVGSLLQKQHDVSEMYTGVMCFAEICRSYRWTQNSEREAHLDPIISEVFPHLLAVGNSILSSEAAAGTGGSDSAGPAEITEVTAAIVKNILKSYKFVTYYDLPRALQSHAALASWGEFHCRVASLEPPAYILAPASESERAQTQLAKCYKWAVANVERLFRRYASRGLSSRYTYTEFQAMFVAEFIPHVMSVYLGLMERWCKGERWLSSTALYHQLDFLSHCVTQKESWQLLRPCFESIVAHFVYPLLCASDETLELFETDPADYINTKLDNFDASEPDVAALGLLVTLVSKRKKTTAEPIVAFAVRQLTTLKEQMRQAQESGQRGSGHSGSGHLGSGHSGQSGHADSGAQTPDSLAVARKTDGALRLVGGISHILTSEKSPYFSQMEAFLAEFVLPHLSSPHAFLRARALDVCSKFADLPLHDENTAQTMYHGILRAFDGSGSSSASTQNTSQNTAQTAQAAQNTSQNTAENTPDDASTCLPVMLQSALAVQAYIQHAAFRARLEPLVVPTMSRLLELSNEIDNESVSVVMQECVENFAAQLQPFGADLMANLVAQFLRLAAEIDDSVSGEIDDYATDFSAESGQAATDKITAALGLLNTMITVLLSFENSRDVCLLLEQTFSPAIEYVLAHQMDDFLAEIGELIENSIFLLRAVSPAMWAHFARLAESFANGVALMYAEDLAPCLKNYMVFGASHLAQTPDATAKLVHVVGLIISGEDGVADYNDIALACDLGSALVLSLQHESARVIPDLARSVLPVLASNQSDSAHVANDELTINSVNFVVACLMYDCATTLQMLEQFQHMASFFESWLALVREPKRVFDIKLSILGLLRVANSPEVAQAVPSLTPHIGSSLAALFKELPAALKNLEKQRADFSSNEYYDDSAFGAGFGGDFGGEFGDELDDEDADLDDRDAAEATPGLAPDASTDNYKAFLDSESSKLSGSQFDSHLEGQSHVVEDVLGATPLDNVDPIVVFKEFSTALQANNQPLYSAIFDNISEADRQVFVDVFQTQ